MDNIFGLDGIKHVGKKAIIGATVRLRRPELFEIGDHSIIDDFAYISCQVKIGNYTHVSAGSKMIGGPEASVEIGDFCNIGANVCIAAGHSDFHAGGLEGPAIPKEYASKAFISPVKINDFCLFGFNCSVLAGVEIPEGCAFGAYSLVKPGMKLKPWTLYAGIKLKEIGPRDGMKIKSMTKDLLNTWWDA